MSVIKQITDVQFRRLHRMYGNRHILGGVHEPADPRSTPLGSRIASHGAGVQKSVDKAAEPSRPGAWRVKFDITVIDGEAGYSRENVFDETDVDRRLAKGGAGAVPVTFSTRAGNAGLRADRCALKMIPVDIGAGRKPQANVLAGDIAGPLHFDGACDGLLTAFLDSFHGGIILEPMKACL